MPKRVIDFDALWASDKLASCAEWAQSEYAWLYGLADASGSFELTNLRVIWGRVAAIRKNLSLERLQEIFDEFRARGLLFTWEEKGKRYGHWTGSDVPGRLPARSWRARLQKLAPPVPAEALAAYSARFGGSKEGIVLRGGCDADSCAGEREDAQEPGLKHGLEEAQAQDWDGGSEADLDLEKQVCPAPRRAQDRNPLGGPSELRARRPEGPGQSHPSEDEGWGTRKTVTTPRQCSAGLPRAAKGLQPGTSPAADAALTTTPAHATAPCGGVPDKGGATFDSSAESASAGCAAEALLATYERERGGLPPAGALTQERRARCERWPAKGFTLQEFREAVRRAANTPFLLGDNPRGWQASFDWLIANRTNMLKVLAGEYDSPEQRRATKSHAGKPRAERHVPADLYTGIGPRPADCGVRVNPAALERIRARQARIRGNAASSDPPEKLAPHAVACGAYHPVAHQTASEPIACNAQARASPDVVNS